jgi:hypothetical protein
MFRGTAPDVRRWALRGTWIQRVQMKGLLCIPHHLKQEEAGLIPVPNHLATVAKLLAYHLKNIMWAKDG